MSLKNSWIFVLLLCAIVFSWSLYRDILAEKQYAPDLRNRVVGARMQKDGLSPYFYKWKKADGFRYYDPNNFDTLKVSNVTASPFFHQLIYPIADFPERTISIYWLFFEFGLFVIMILITLLFATTNLQKRLVLITGCAFLLTEAWKMHVYCGQYYILIPFFALLFYWCISHNKMLWTSLPAGVCIAILLLIRPNALVFFIPFVILLKRYKKIYVVLLFIPLLIAGTWITCNSEQRYLWKEYKENLAQQLKLHQQESPEVQVNEPNPQFKQWEGINHNEIEKNTILHPVHIYSENGNFFVLVRLIFHTRVNTFMLAIFSFCIILFLMVIFFIRHRLSGFSLFNIGVLGFCLLMVSDLFSPVYRHQYYAVQWIFLALLSASAYRRSQWKIYLLAGTGLFLNIVNIPFVPMEHTVGEYIMLLAFIVLSLQRETQIFFSRGEDY